MEGVTPLQVFPWVLLSLLLPFLTPPPRAAAPLLSVTMEHFCGFFGNFHKENHSYEGTLVAPSGCRQRDFFSDVPTGGPPLHCGLGGLHPFAINIFPGFGFKRTKRKHYRHC